MATPAALHRKIVPSKFGEGTALVRQLLSNLRQVASDEGRPNDRGPTTDTKSGDEDPLGKAE
jgi:hypothetical protein